MANVQVRLPRQRKQPGKLAERPSHLGGYYHKEP